MNTFLFITHVTPSRLRSTLRQSLYELQKLSLSEQTYGNWKQLVIGEDDIVRNSYLEVKLQATTKADRNAELIKIYERKEVKELLENSDYILKLDDDDIISPTLLGSIASRDFDLYYDNFHTFYDITSNSITQQERGWIASSCVHKTAHALSKLDAKGPDNYYQNSLLYSDHSKTWHTYYANKNKIAANPDHPVYLRVLSPTSITAGAKKFPLVDTNDIDFKQYYQYLKGFGYWQQAATTDFNFYLPKLKKAWTDFSGMEPQPIPNIGMSNQIVDTLKNYGKAIRKLF